ncbi:MAG: glycosyltransferase [Candidatus Sulfotelmatobacter sp.]
MLGLSVLLLTKNGADGLERLLPELFGQKSVAPFEVIAIDSGSTDGTVELLAQYPLRIHHIPAETFHHARTRNFAATLATGQILTFLSQDAVPASDHWLASLIANFADPGVGAVYGRQIPRPESLAERRDTFDTIYGTQKIIKDPAHRNPLGYRFYLFSNVNAAIRRDVWEATRFPENLKVFEDMGIAKRILHGGWKIVYEPEAAVIHSHHHSTLGLFKRYFDLGYTLKELKIWDAPGTKASLSRDAWKLLKKKFTRAPAATKKRRAGEALEQEIAKSAGLFLGLNQALLPLAVKRRLSAYHVFG